MPEMTEQEKLAQLVGGADLEPLRTDDMLADGLRFLIGNPSEVKVQQVSREIESHGDTIARVGTRQIAPDGKPVTIAGAEKILIALYDVREELVKAFEGCGINSGVGNVLADQINRVGSCIRIAGGEVEDFEPLNHISGLEMPDLNKNLEQVIARTIQCYKLGEVKEAKIKNGNKGKEIHIVFLGKNNEINYKVTGYIQSEVWSGNEAIDYIYTAQGGKMSIKTFEDNKWLDKTSSGRYAIHYQLEEVKLPVARPDEDGKTYITAATPSAPEQSSKNVTANKENTNITKNNMDDDDIGSPLSESK